MADAETLQPDHRSEFEGDYIPKSKDSVPFDDSFANDDLFRDILKSYDPFFCVPLICAIDTLNKWEEAAIEEQNSDEFWEGIDSTVGDIIFAPQNQENLLPSFISYFFDELHIREDAQPSILLHTRVIQGEEELIVITTEQARLLSYLFGVLVPEADAKAKYVAHVRISDENHELVEYRDIPLAANRKLHLDYGGSVVITSAVETFTKKECKDHTVYHNLEITGIESNIARTDFIAPNSNSQKQSKKKRN
ncbi:hypothetical protein C5B42_02900 [Candidatus Cerribacteria bacterium 'Amazon FNV 2010 28 9']|uniref:Uncharacterized protein n=1 Tax=Candidatus Cerribacteria bacterium 'Amazon FNV 2010 28 9' TaxID=2081795 RepID=A0A317JRJ4_9BACT|nr:MAG: hypothetical protein C5B42_02900 [Candidatus Cerribacteria bacterium 'Amazon FNV 2010 28 9']